MNNIYEFFENNRIDKKSRILLSLSGGGDSVFLFYLFLKARIDFSCAYFQHNLRKDSVKEEEFVKALCKKHSVKLYYAQREKEWNNSIENNAREERYAFLFDVLYREKFDYIATAHNKDDVIETFFINLFRGSGIYGLASIKEKDEKRHIIRPILNITREEIRDSLRKDGIEWYDDPTNEKDIFIRNKIRLQLLPIMKEIFPSYKDTIFRTASNLREYGDLLENILKNYKYILPDEGIYLDCKMILNYNNYSILHALLKDMKMDREFYINLYDLCKKDIGKQLNTKGIVAVKGRYGIYIKGRKQVFFEKYPIKTDKQQINGWKIFIEDIERKNLIFDKGDRFLFLDDLQETYIGSIKRDEKIVHWNNRVYSVKELFSMKHIDSIWLDYMPGIYKGDELIFIPGVFRSRKFSVKGNDKIFKIGVMHNAYRKVLERRGY